MVPGEMDSHFGWYDASAFNVCPMWRKRFFGLESSATWRSVLKLEQADIIAQVAQFAEQAAAAIAVAVIVVVASVFKTPLKIVHQHFAADHCGCATQRAHSHLAAAALEEAAKSALLLTLRGSHAGGWHDASQAGVTTGAGGCSLWSHCHTDGTAQDHRLLSKHWSRLRILLLRIARSILRLTILWLLWILRLLLILWLLRHVLRRLLRILRGLLVG